MSNATVSSFRCSVRRNGNFLSVTRQNECRIDLIRFFADAAASDEENGLIDRLTEGLPEAISEPVDLSLAELRMLASIRDRQNPAPVVPPAAPSAPAVVQVVPPAPLPATPAQVVQGQMSAHERHGLNRSLGNESCRMERTAAQLARAEKFWSQNFWQINYYIPAEQSDASGAEHIPNPCRFLRQMGALHEDGSNWFIDEETFLSAPMQEWIADFERRADAFRARTYTYKPARVWRIPYAPGYSAELKRRTRESLDNYIRGLHTSLITRLASAEDRFQRERERVESTLRPMVDAVTQAAALASDPHAARRAIEKAHEARENAVRGALRDSIRDLETARALAEKYDDEMATADLLDALRALIREEGQTFNHAARNNGRRPLRLPG